MSALEKSRVNNEKLYKIFNLFVDILLVIITAVGSFQNGWFTLANLVSWLGIIGVIGLARKWQGNFFFNGAQNVFNMVVSWRNRIYGDAIMAAYYFLMEFVGYFDWSKNKDEDGNLIVKENKSVKLWGVIIGAILIAGLGLGLISKRLGGDQVWLDAFNNATAVIAQYLQMTRHRSSWLLWMVTNVAGIIIWVNTGEYQMAVMYLVFTINSIRGFINWGRGTTEEISD